MRATFLMIAMKRRRWLGVKNRGKWLKWSGTPLLFPSAVRLRAITPGLRECAVARIMVFLKKKRSIMPHTAFMNFIHVNDLTANGLSRESEPLLPFDFSSISWGKEVFHSVTRLTMIILRLILWFAGLGGGLLISICFEKRRHGRWLLYDTNVSI